MAISSWPIMSAVQHNRLSDLASLNASVLERLPALKNLGLGANRFEMSVTQSEHQHGAAQPETQGGAAAALRLPWAARHGVRLGLGWNPHKLKPTLGSANPLHAKAELSLSDTYATVDHLYDPGTSIC